MHELEELRWSSDVVPDPEPAPSVAPGRRTLTERLARASDRPRSRPTARPPGVARPAGEGAMLDGLFDAAMRPDLPVTSAPIQAKLELSGLPAQPIELAASAGGQALPAALSAEMGAAFGADFGSVRVHADSEQVQAMGARAMASAEALHFAPGEYQPDAASGRSLIGHELAHVVQQRQGRVRGAQGKGQLTVDDALEREADEAGDRAARGEAVGMGDGAQRGPVIQPFLLLRFDDGMLMAATGLRDLFRGALVAGLRGRESTTGDEVEFVALADDGGFVVRRVRDGARLRYARDGERFVVLDGGEPRAEPDPRRPNDDGRGGKRERLAPDDDRARADGEPRGAAAVDEDDEAPADAEALPSSHAELQAALELSQEDEPLDERLLTHAQEMIDGLLGQRGARALSTALTKLLATARRHRVDYNAQLVRRPPRARRQRADGEDAPVAARTYDDDDSASELSDQEPDADRRLDRDRLAWSATANHSHGYGDGTGDDEASRRERDLATGLPHADTYAALLRDGSLVPRTINGRPNAHGHRHPMGPVQGHLDAMRPERDRLYARLEALRAAARALRGRPLREAHAQIEAVTAEVRALLRSRARPHLEGVLYGSSIRIDEADAAASAANREAREAIHRGLVRDRDDRSPVANLARQRAHGDLQGAADTDTHAEQTIVNSRAWVETMDRLVAAIREHVGSGVAAAPAPTRFDLFINRTTCLGCGRELALELIRLWSAIAHATRWKDWREARARLAGVVRFTIQIPAIYQRPQEEAADFANLRGIVLGLEDAGWEVLVTRGLPANDGARERNQEARARVDGWTGRAHGADDEAPDRPARGDPEAAAAPEDGALHAAVAASMVGAYQLTEFQRGRLAAWHRAEVPIDPDGNCLFNAFAATHGVAGGGAAVRRAIHAALANRDDPRFAPLRERGNFQTEFLDNLASPKPFDFAGEAGDAMPEILAAVYGVTLHLARSGQLTLVGAGPAVYLLRFDGAGLHFHGTRPA